MSFAWEDDRIVRGMEQQLRARRELLSSGGKSLGWKLAFGGPAAMARLHINAPLVGFLMQSAVVPTGSTISLEGWTKPAAEPELALYMGRDLPAGADRSTAIASIARLGPAIEVADVDHPSDDVEGTLARNIYQRHVIAGDSQPIESANLLAGLRARVFRNDAKMTDTTDFEALTGELIDIVRHVANLLNVFGEKLEAGQMIIAGSITPPIWVGPGEKVVFELAPLPKIFVAFEPHAGMPSGG
jgi:2-keto-4-pentenoate hydratase